MARFSSIATVAVGLLAIWSLSSCFFLLRNYMKARAIGLAIRALPISHLNPLWFMVDRRIVSLVKRLPFGLGNNTFTRYNWRSWEIEDRYSSHREMGTAFVMVTAHRNWLYIANPETLTEVFRRRVDLPRCVELSEMLDVFGPSIATAEGDRWKIQPKITASCFNEPNNEIVWREALWLARDMLKYWTSKPSVATTADDCRTLSLHVLSRAGFGKSFKFEGHDGRDQGSPAASYKNSLQMILENCILIVALGTKTLANPWLPGKLRKIHEACSVFQEYMTDMYEAEKAALAEGRAGAGNIMSSLVRASQEEVHSGQGLTESEIYGNMFTFNFAGHDTTAHTLTYAVYLLAANPETQAWIHEEIREVLADNDAEWSYTNDFPRLKRCLAIMMECLRLYTPVPVSKWTAQQVQTLDIGGGKVVELPPAQ